MIYINNLKKSVFLISVIFLASCSQVQESNPPIPIQDNSKKIFIDYIDIMSSDDNEYSPLFLEGSRHIKIGTIDKAEEIFRELKSSSDKKANEYGEFGLLLIAYETDNMPDMKQQLQIIENINPKSEWLENEFHNYNVLYNFISANYDKADALLASTKEKDLSDNPMLATVKSALYLRENKINEAIGVLKRLQVENEESIATMAILISFTEGYDSAIDYLLVKKNANNNELLELMYNQFLVYEDKDSAYDNIYKLGMKTQNTYILVYCMELLYLNEINDDILEKLNKLQNRLDKLEVAQRYIDYYLNGIALPVNNEELHRNFASANEFNPMNYRLLWHEYYYSKTDDKLDYLHKIEKIDPYDNVILIELAKYYNDMSMNNELDDIKQRFNDSKRLKTEAEIEFMNSL